MTDKIDFNKVYSDNQEYIDKIIILFSLVIIIIGITYKGIVSGNYYYVYKFSYIIILLELFGAKLGKLLSNELLSDNPNIENIKLFNSLQKMYNNASYILTIISIIILFFN